MSSAVCIPIQVSTFTLNAAVANSGKDVPNWCVGPLSQPNYDRLLRYENDVQQHADMLNRHRLESLNPRLFDAFNKEVRQNRQGLYLHWKLPQLYRATAEVSAGADEFKNECFKNGFLSLERVSETEGGAKWNANASKATIGESSSLYRAVPNRWLVWRRIHEDSIQPKVAVGKIKKYELFIIESNLCRNISELGPEIDIEVDVSPFVDAEKPPEGQEDMFLGNKISVYADGAQPPNAEEGEKKSVPLSIFNSSNPLFADFQPHNSNVFSMVDTFSYQHDLGNGKSETRTLTEANADYFVLGWVHDAKLDIFSAKSKTHGEVLKELGLELADGDAANAQDWLKSCDRNNDITRAMCHASIYGATWRKETAPENKAHELASLITERMAVSVGYSPLDSLGAFARVAPESFQRLNGAKLDPSLTGTPKSFSDLIYEVQTFTKTSPGNPDNYLAQRDRALLLAFTVSSLGYVWKLIDKGDQTNSQKPQSEAKTSLIPSDTQKLALDGLGKLQSFRDACECKLKQLRWDLFAEWWKVKTSEKSMAEVDLKGLRSSSSDAVRPIVSDIRRLMSICNELDRELDTNKVAEKCPQAEKTPSEPFYQRREPTVTVARAVSAWNIRDNKPTRVRITSQVYPKGEDQETKAAFTVEANATDNLEDSLYNAMEFHRPKMNAVVFTTMQELVREWVRLGPKDDQRAPKRTTKPSIVSPPYESRTLEDDEQLGNVPNFNKKQEFNAMFVEWEAVYFHIPFDKWSLLPDEATGLRWDLNEYVGSGHTHDVRTISGRDLLLPQVKAELQVAAANLEYFSEEFHDLLLDRLCYPSSSFSLNGMNEHLSTRYVGGTHLTPNATLSGVVKGAVVESVFTEDDIELIGNQTRETPYAGTVDIGATDGDTDDMPSPFKPVLHGQMVLTKLNLVDEFGQVVSAFDFDKAPSDNFLDRKIYPEVSDTYACSNLVDPHGKPTKIANAVVGDQENRCAFFQIPPSINQEARLNAFFVTDKDVFGKLLPPDEPYRPIHEQWENPVWGWVLVNYASYGVQFFLPNGKFYGQVLLGGSTGTDIPLRWQPFEEPPADLKSVSADSVDVRRLQELMDVFRQDPDYLKAFIHMIGESLTLSKDMDPSYSESLASITGRCLALVDFGVSLELAQKPRENQSTINDAPPQLELQDYKFPCIFGDVERREDGMVGYFVPSSAASRKPDFSTCYTYFPQGKQKASKNGMKEIASQNYPFLQPQYADPLELTRSLFVEPENALNPDTLDRMSSEFRKATSNSLSIFTAIINPYTPFHVRTAGLLPSKALQIPSWTIKNALEKMDVFFPAGPVLTLDATLSKPISPPTGIATMQQSKVRSAGEETSKSRMEVPTPPVGKWAWLQPTLNEKESKTKYKEIETDGLKRIEDDNILRINNRQPLTAIEGYLGMSWDNDRNKV